MTPFPKRKYGVICADPPWPTVNLRLKMINQTYPYPLMPIAELRELPVGKICMKNCVLFLWSVQSQIPSALGLMKEWGFRYQRIITWHKRRGLTAFGFHHRTELMLFGYRGILPHFPRRRAFPTLVEADPGAHSEKPAIFQELMEPFGKPRIELFARTRVPGWDAWGNEV